MDVIIDDGPFLDLEERADRPRSRTWPLPDPCLMAIKTEEEQDRSPQNQVSNDIELSKKLCETVSPRKNNRKNAWGNLSYADLITQAIDSSPEKRLTLAQIYDWMVKNVPYFKDKGDSTSSAGWKVNIKFHINVALVFHLFLVLISAQTCCNTNRISTEQSTRFSWSWNLPSRWQA